MEAIRSPFVDSKRGSGIFLCYLGLDKPQNIYLSWLSGANWGKSPNVAEGASEL